MSKDSSTLLQLGSASDMSINASNELGLDESLQASTKSTEKQLVAEAADQTEDNKDDLALQVPLTSRNDAVYMGTIWMGSPES